MLVMGLICLAEVACYPRLGYKPFLGCLSVTIAFTGYMLYIAAMFERIEPADRQIRPHPLSWALFGFLTGTESLVQFASGGKAGSWCLAITAVFCFLITGLSVAKYTWTFDRADWLWVASGLVLFLFYLSTKTPTTTATLVTLADLAAYGPILRKAWRQPWADDSANFAFNSVKCVPAMLALSSYSWATCAFPAMLFVMNGVASLLLVTRRAYATNGRRAGSRLSLP